MKVRPTDRNAVLDIALDGRSLRASHSEPAEVPNDIGERLLASPVWERPSGHSEPTVDEVLSDVGDDREKAAVALAAERAKGESATIDAGAAPRSADRRGGLTWG
jgi:hypothetical protein